MAALAQPAVGLDARGPHPVCARGPHPVCGRGRIRCARAGRIPARAPRGGAVPELAPGPDVAPLGPADIREIGEARPQPGQAPGPELRHRSRARSGASLTLAAALAPEDVVLEVGPGFGSLTLAAARRPPARSSAVEVDPVLAAELPADRRAPCRCAGWPSASTVVHRRRRPGQLQRARPTPPTALVGQPARTTSRSRWCCTCWRWSRRCAAGLVMVQAEVADRMHAAAGQPGVRRALGQAGLVRCRSRRAGSGAAQRVLAGAEGGFRAGRLHQARPAGGARLR